MILFASFSHEGKASKQNALDHAYAGLRFANSELSKATDQETMKKYTERIESQQAIIELLVRHGGKRAAVIKD